MGTEKMDVTALGELLIDFVHKGNNELGSPIMHGNPGGAPCNFLCALASCGEKTAFIGKVGEDAFGHMLKKTLDDHGIDTTGLLIDPDVFTTINPALLYMNIQIGNTHLVSVSFCQIVSFNN